MCKYAFLFGRNPSLSYLELVSYLNARGIDFKPLIWFKEGVIAEIEKMDAEKLVKELAGTIKIAEVLFTCHTEELEQKLLQANLYEGTSNKLMYFVSAYNANEMKIREILKRVFKEQRLKAVYKMLAPHTLAKKLQNYVDIIAVKEQKYYIAKTILCSDPHKFKERDEGRPFQEPEIMSSIRLSRILVNLSCTRPKATILDPFSGIGTVLQEAMLLGYNVKGLELSEERVQKSIANLEWVKKKYNIKQNFEVKKGDATMLSNYFEEERFDAIVTEPELGPLLKKLPTEKEAKETCGKLQKLYEKFFNEAKLVLKPEEKIVVVIPQFRTKNSRLFTINMDKILHENGFRIFNATENLPIKAGVPYLYKEEWHRIERLIYVLEKALK